jgi:uncharacterized phage protein (TIGR01671 family)
MKMREIKFRAWNHQIDKMIKISSLNFFIDGHVAIDGTIPADKDMALMQYTGLKDKNGKEIYEGDILKTDKGSLLQVIWHPHLACFLGIEATNEFAISAKEFMKIDFVEAKFWYLQTKTVGNIYENPELLEKENA